MNKKQVAQVLEEIAVLLELAGENPFKARSYQSMARTIEQMEEDLETLVAENRLREVKGLGEALEKKITELVTTGKLAYHQELRDRFPESLFELFGIPGLGAKRIKTLYDEMHIQSLEQLEEACRANRLLGLKGFGPKMQEKLIKGIEFANQHLGLHLFHHALAEAECLLAPLAKHPAVERIALAGSLRRRKEVIKDIDIIASSRAPADVMQAFVTSESVDDITGHGDTKSSARLLSGIAADLRVVTLEQFPYALAHFTGSKEHNVAMRQRAKDRGMKLSEYGLFRGDVLVPCAEEAQIYAALDLPYIPPELREDMGEFEAEPLPDLVDLDQLIGIFHCHSTYSDGANTIEQMARACQERGYHYLAMADHSQSAAYAGGLNPDAVLRQQKEIDALNKKLKSFRVLKGIESDIRLDGSLDYDADLLKTFEFIVASVHSKLDMSEEEATRRVVKAVENPYTTILGHPTGRLLLQRTGYALDFDKVFDACLANRVAIEINANPHRFDIDWRYIRRARDKGLKLVIGPDAHSTAELDLMEFGVGLARKGWLEAGDLLNTMTAEEFLKWRSCE